ncbi:restriction endonuclease subunit S [Streptococcus thermophilus]|nr:restriction endonuclease subunit S [Streptococcus thermophilus]
MVDSFIPQIRFKMCKNQWEKIKLSKIAKFNPKSTLPEKFKYVDLESVLGTDLISYREVSRENAPSRAQRLAQKGDIFYQTVRPYQKNNYLFDSDEKDYVFSTGYAQLRPLIDSAFLLARLQEESFVNKVLERCTGTSYPAINSKDLSKISVTIPQTVEEQSAIGSLFRLLDDLLSSYKDNLANYQSLKATMLSKMFPKAGHTVPEIRLEGFEGEWVLIKLGDFCDLITKGTTGKSQSEKGEVNFVKVENLKDNEIYPIVKISEEEHFGSLKRSILYEGDILFSIAGTLGRTAIVKNNILPANTNQALAIIRGYKLDAYFLLVVLSGDVVKDYIRKNPTVGAQPNLSLEQVSSLKIKIPSLDEQQAIGSYFSNLDNLIAAHQEKISQLETLKKKLLQDMFI